MSCRAMGFGGSGAAYLCGSLAAVVVYSCGPNMIVGVPCALYLGWRTLIEKIEIATLRTLANDITIEEDRETELNGRIHTLETEKNKHASLAKIAAISSIPIVGPLIVLLSGLKPPREVYA
jgi:hypothetical protein